MVFIMSIYSRTSNIDTILYIKCSWTNYVIMAKWISYGTVTYPKYDGAYANPTS